MRCLTIIFCVVLVLFSFHQAQATVIHVPADSSTIQGGINGAVNGDTVLVARGHYYERINFLGKAILVASNFIFDDDTMTIDSTIIDADTLVLGISDTGSVIRFVNGEDSTSLLTGFTIQNGTGTRISTSEIYGGGIYCSSGCSSRVSHCIITNNSAQDGHGGGIYVKDGSPAIFSCIITSNRGGGIYCPGRWSDTPVIEKCTVSGNDGCGIIYKYAVQITIIECKIEGNAGPGVLGVAYYSGHYVTIVGCEIRGNDGSGISLGGALPIIEAEREKDFQPRIVNCIIENNSGRGIYSFVTNNVLIEDCLIKDNLGGGIGMNADASITMTGCTVVGNSAEHVYMNDGGGIFHSDCVGDRSSITNCIFVDNRANNRGGAIYGDCFDITNCTFVGNSANAGAVIYYNKSGPQMLIENCLFAFNLSGELITCGTPEAPLITYGDIYGNAGGDWVGCIADQSDTNGNFSANPQFCDTANGNFYLWNTSPCLGAGQGGGDIGTFGLGCAFALTPGPDHGGAAHSQVSACFYVQNIGHSLITVDLDISDQLGWFIDSIHYELVLDSGQVDTVHFTVSIPYVPIGSTDTIFATAFSRTDSTARDSASLAVTCNAYVEGLEITPGNGISAPAHSQVTAVFYIRNTGLAPDSCYLSVSDSLGWNIQPQSYHLTLNPGEQDSVSFDIQIPSTSLGTKNKVTLTGMSLTNPFVVDSASLFVTCESYNVTITNISDVGNDQGKQVRIRWSSFPGSDSLVTDFTIFRRIDTLVFADSGADPSLNLSLDYPPGEWELIKTVPAFGETLYVTIVPTLKDSTIVEGMYWSVFFLRAGTNNPIVYFDSPIDSGYSLDNLSPSPPTGLSASHQPAITRLTWKTTSALDFDYYSVYRDTLSGFTPGLSNRLGFTIDTAFVDSTAQLGRTYFYLASATDFSGNESDPSNQAMGVRYITGDANVDGVINSADIVYLINYLFAGGLTPLPLAAGDVNCDGVVNVADVVYLINYLFAGGPPPCQ